MKKKGLKFKFAPKYIRMFVDGSPILMLPFSSRNQDVKDFICERCKYATPNIPMNENEHCLDCIYFYTNTYYYKDNPCFEPDRKIDQQKDIVELLEEKDNKI